MKPSRMIIGLAVALSVCLGFVPAYAGPPCDCDLTSDGRCDMRDWLIFGQRWGATKCSTVSCACDLNADGRCDMRDWLLFGQGWGRTDCPPPAPKNLGAWFEDDEGIAADVWATLVPGATGYNLYASTDDNTYSQVSASQMIMGNSIGFLLDVTQNTYFKMSALNGNGESERSASVYLSYDDKASHPEFSITSPADESTGVSLTPTIAWDPSPVPSTASYLILVAKVIPEGWENVSLKTVSTSAGHWTYGSSQDVLVTYLESSPLEPNTRYSVSMAAFDATGTLVAEHVHSAQFTTGPY